MYSAASQVLIWLGPKDESTSDAFELVNTLGLPSSDNKAALNCHDVSTYNANLLLDLDRWRGLSKFFSRTSFSSA
jgi:hypothetical protein